MADLKLRGQDVRVTMTVEGIEFRFQGEKFSHKPVMETTRHDYLGEDSSEIDQTFDGHDFSFEAPRTDAQALRYIQLCQERQAQGLPWPKCLLTVTENYRTRGQKPVTIAFPEASVVIDLDAPGRKEYAMQKFEGKARKMLIV